VWGRNGCEKNRKKKWKCFFDSIVHSNESESVDTIVGVHSRHIDVYDDMTGWWSESVMIEIKCTDMRKRGSVGTVDVCLTGGVIANDLRTTVSYTSGCIHAYNKCGRGWCSDRALTSRVEPVYTGTLACSWSVLSILTNGARYDDCNVHRRKKVGHGSEWSCWSIWE